jgi:hypothetical protein
MNSIPLNSIPLSESMPNSGNGNTAWISTSAANTCRAALFRTLRTSVQPVAMSVTVNEQQKSPLLSPPSWPTKSNFDETRPLFIPVRPRPHRDLGLQQRSRFGVGLALKLQLATIRDKPAIDRGRRHGDSKAAVRSSTSNSPWRRSEATSSGSAGAGRFPVAPSNVAQHTRSASTTCPSYFNTAGRGFRGGRSWPGPGAVRNALRA